jgi:hypothetical protein
MKGGRVSAKRELVQPEGVQRELPPSPSCGVLIMLRCHAERSPRLCFGRPRRYHGNGVATRGGSIYLQIAQGTFP